MAAKGDAATVVALEDDSVLLGVVLPNGGNVLGLEGNDESGVEDGEGIVLLLNSGLCGGVGSVVDDPLLVVVVADAAPELDGVADLALAVLQVKADVVAFPTDGNGGGVVGGHTSRGDVELLLRVARVALPSLSDVAVALGTVLDVDAVGGVDVGDGGSLDVPVDIVSGAVGEDNAKTVAGTSGGDAELGEGSGLDDKLVLVG